MKKEVVLIVFLLIASMSLIGYSIVQPSFVREVITGETELCGNGLLDANEFCDGTDFGLYLDGIDQCSNYDDSFLSGNLRCFNCRIITTSCQIRASSSGSSQNPPQNNQHTNNQNSNQNNNQNNNQNTNQNNNPPSGGGGGGSPSTPTNNPPVWLSPGPFTPQTAFETFEIQIQFPFATDRDNDLLTYTLEGAPPFSNFNSQTHIFSWTPNYGEVNGRSDEYGPVDARIHLIVKDGKGGEARRTVSFRVNNFDRQPTSPAKPIMINGEPFIPIMSNGVPINVDGQPIIPRLKNLGFNTVTTEAFGVSIDKGTTQGSQERADAIANAINSITNYLTQAQAEEMKVLVIAHQPEIVQAIHNHPALLGYLLPDEPDQAYFGGDNYYSPSNFAGFADAIREIDNDHPVFIDVSSWFTKRRRPEEWANSAGNQIYQQYMDIADVIAFNIYIETSNTAPTNPIPKKILAGFVEEAREITGDQKPIVVYIEGVNYCNQNVANPLICEPKPAAQHNYPITPSIVRDELTNIFEGGAAGVVYYTANYYDGDGDGDSDRHPFELHPSLESAMPEINDIIVNGITSVDVTPSSGTYPKEITFRATTNRFSPTYLVWETPFDNPSTTGKRESTQETEYTVTANAPGIYFAKVTASDSSNNVATKFFSFTLS